MSDKKTILLVDDDPTFIETTTIFLEKDYDVRTAPSGKACLEMLKHQKFDLIILDVMMRHLSEGFETAKKIKTSESTKDIPVLILTGVKERYDYTEEVSDEYYPRDGYLDKPVSPETLLNEVKRLIGDS